MLNRTVAGPRRSLHAAASSQAPCARTLSEPLPQFSVLTPREQDVMLCIARGMPNKIIGASLGISQRTVEAHRARIFRKLNIRNAVELVNYVWQECHPAIASALVSDDLAADPRQLQFRAGRSASSSIGSMSA